MPVRPPLFVESPPVSTSEAMRRWAVGGARPRVLLVARWPVAGVRAHLRANYLALCAAGFRFTLVGPDDESLLRLRTDFDGVEDVDFVAAPVENRRCRLWPVVRGLLREGRFGLLHAHGVTAAVHAALANLGIGVPHIVTLHEPLRDNQFPGWLGGLKRWTLTRALQQADAIVTASDGARANLLEHMPSLRGRADRLFAVPNGIPAEYYQASPNEESDDLRCRLGLEGPVRLFGFFGDLLTEKGFGVLLEAIDLLRRRETPRSFHLAAFGGGDFRRHQQKIVLRRGLEKWVSLLAAAATSPALLEQLDLIVVPSSSEASARVAREALALGVPIVGGDCLGLREVLRGTPARLVATNDPAALAGALHCAVDDPGTSAARAFAPLARARFDNDHSVRRLTALLESLARRTTSTIPSEPLAA
jgi:glycosyltransferase involved in cell wall biosynthesis